MRTFALVTDVDPDPRDLKPFFDRPKAIRIEVSDDLSAFRLRCDYRLDPPETGVPLSLQACEFMRLVDGRIARIVFREDRPRTRQAFDEAADALMTLRLYAAQLRKDAARAVALRESAEFVHARWISEETMLRMLLAPAA